MNLDMCKHLRYHHTQGNRYIQHLPEFLGVPVLFINCKRHAVQQFSRTSSSCITKTLLLWTKGILTPYQIHGLQIFFSHGIGWLLIPLTVSFAVNNLFNLMWFYLLFFLLLLVLLMSYPRNYCLDRYEEAFLLSFPRSFTVSDFTLILNPLWVDLCVWCKVEI